MRRLTLLLLVTALGLSCSRNTPPVIEIMIADPDSVYPRDTVNLGFIAPFGNKDVLHFEWSCASGRIILPTFPAKSYGWVASVVPGVYFIKLEVSINELVTTDSIKVIVQDTIGTFTDARDGHLYKWVKIGSQIWMAENLAYLPEVSPSSIYSESRKQFYVNGFEGTDIAAAKTSDNFKFFGVLYNDPASTDACPTGWQLPDTVNWKILTQYLGNDAAGDLKSITGWKKDYWGVDGNGNNSSGFNAFPGGCYYYTYGHGGYGAFNPPGETAEFHSQNGRIFSLLRSNSYFRIGSSKKEDGYSVRCIRKNG